MSLRTITMLGIALLMTAACAQAPQEVAEDVEDLETTPAAERSEPATAPAPRPAPKRPSNVTIPEGTMLEGSLNQTLSSGVNQTGDGFTVEVIEPVVVGGRMVIPAGSTIHGTVEDVKKAKRGAGNASMTLVFTELELPGGYTTEMSASLSERSEGKKKRNAAVISGSAAGGAILGKVLGGDTKDAVVGGIVGGAIGTGIVLAQEGAQVEIPAGTPIALTLDQPIQVPAS